MHRHSKVEIYTHLVFATKGREHLLNRDLVRPVYRCLESIVLDELKSDLLEIGGMPDHVHIIAKIHSTISTAELAKKVKGGSSRFINDQRLLPSHFRWQEGYGAFSISRSHVTRVRAYILNQPRHHANHTEWPEWEEISEQE